MDIVLRLSLAAVFPVAAVVLAVIASRRNGLRGTPASMRERLLISTPVTVLVWACGITALNLW